VKRPRLLRLLFLLCFGIALIIAVLFALSIREGWRSSHRLSAALKDARAVSFVEFTRGMISGELIFSRVTAKADDIARLKTATSPWVAVVPPWKAMCFTPHHRVEITRADGSQTRFDICFLCHNFAFDREPEITLPAAWQHSLATFFASVGMPARTSEEYREHIAKHPDHELLDKELRDIDRQLEKEKGQP
jgi:hypothetical protein